MKSTKGKQVYLQVSDVIQLPKWWRNITTKGIARYIPIELEDVFNECDMCNTKAWFEMKDLDMPFCILPLFKIAHTHTHASMHPHITTNQMNPQYKWF